MARDPVCKMDVEEKDAAATSEYKRKIYYFCTEQCKTTFDKNPDKYLDKEQEEEDQVHYNLP